MVINGNCGVLNIFTSMIDLDLEMTFTKFIALASLIAWMGKESSIDVANNTFSLFDLDLNLMALILKFDLGCSLNPMLQTCPTCLPLAKWNVHW